MDKKLVRAPVEVKEEEGQGTEYYGCSYVVLDGIIL